MTRPLNTLKVCYINIRSGIVSKIFLMQLVYGAVEPIRLENYVFVSFKPILMMEFLHQGVNLNMQKKIICYYFRKKINKKNTNVLKID